MVVILNTSGHCSIWMILFLFARHYGNDGFNSLYMYATRICLQINNTVNSQPYTHKNHEENTMHSVCIGFIVPLENFLLIQNRHHYRRRASNFDICSALMAIEQWGFLSMPRLLWHGASAYNGHLRGPVTLTNIAERVAVELSLPVFTTNVCRRLDSNNSKHKTMLKVNQKYVMFIE